MENKIIIMHEGKKLLFDEHDNPLLNNEHIISPLISETSSLTFFSWNVNMYTQDVHDFLLKYIKENKPTVVFLSETKKPPEYLSKFFSEFKDYKYIINAHNPRSWHGVAMLIKNECTYIKLDSTFTIDCRKDSHGASADIGRIIAIKLAVNTNHNWITIVGSYTPNSGRQEVEKLDYRVNKWDPEFKEYINELRNGCTAYSKFFNKPDNGYPTIWMGDINVAQNEIDISHPSKMKYYAGFTPEERKNFNNLFEEGKDDENAWIDIWRLQHPNEKGFTWRGKGGSPDYGMRLDNIIITKDLVKYVASTEIVNEKALSADHVGVSMTLNF